MRLVYKVCILMICFLGGFQTIVKGDVVQKNFYQAEVNWSTFSITVQTREPVPKIDVLSSTSSWSEARRIAFENAYSANRSRLNVSLESLILNENYTLGEYLEENPRFKESFIRYFNSYPEKVTRYYDKNFLVLTSTIKFLGSGNLLSLLYNEWGGDGIPEVRDELPEEKYTGFILDAKGLKFQPSLFPKIQLEDGRDILNTYIASPAAIQEIGIVGYVNTENSKEIRKRVGNHPLRIPVLYVTGKNRTNLVVPFEESVKILSSPTNRNHWRLCKVIVLID